MVTLIYNLQREQPSNKKQKDNFILVYISFKTFDDVQNNFDETFLYMIYA